jgi:hypothetical protein
MFVLVQCGVFYKDTDDSSPDHGIQYPAIKLICSPITPTSHPLMDLSTSTWARGYILVNWSSGCQFTDEHSPTLMVSASRFRVCGPFCQGESTEQRDTDYQGSVKDLGKQECGIIKSYHTPELRK